jgi:hypothetical protein
MTTLKDIQFRHNESGTEIVMMWANKANANHRYQAVALNRLDPISVIHMFEDAIRILEKEINEGHLIL